MGKPIFAAPKRKNLLISSQYDESRISERDFNEDGH